MIDAANVAQLWGDHFDRSVAEMMNVQSDISKAIAENLRMQLTSDDHKGMVAGTTQNAKAYFEQAIAQDPSYALAYAGLASGYSQQALFGYSSPSETFPKAIAAAKK